MNKYINSEAFDIDYIVDQVYDFSKLGGMSIREAMPEEAVNDLLSVIVSNKDVLVPAQRVLGQVTQEMNTLYFERHDRDKLPKDLVEKMDIFRDEFQEIYGKIAKIGNFNVKDFNSLGIHEYPKGTMGITPHQDFSADSDLIASFILQGEAPFFICENRGKDGSMKLNSHPGNVILMRAARNKSEQKARPFHYVEGPMNEDRYVILIRNRTTKKMKELEDKYLDY